MTFPIGAWIFFIAGTSFADGFFPPSCPRIGHRHGPREADVGVQPAPSSEERNVVDNLLTGAAAGVVVGQGGHLVADHVYLFDFALVFTIGLSLRGNVPSFS